MKPALLHLLVIGAGLNISCIVTGWSGYWCYDQKCSTFNGTFIDCDNELNVCKQTFNIHDEVKCIPGNYSFARVYCYSMVGMRDRCHVDDVTGKARCPYYSTSRPPITEHQSKTNAPPIATEDPHSFEDRDIYLFIILPAIIGIGFTLTLLLWRYRCCYHCAQRYNRRQYVATHNDIEMSDRTQPQLDSVYPTVPAPVPGVPVYPPPPAPGVPFYPTAPTQAPSAPTHDPSAPTQDVSFYPSAPTQNDASSYRSPGCHGQAAVPLYQAAVPLDQQGSGNTPPPPSYHDVIGHPENY
eukprot:sb/3467493/